jgi:hypothetical protein
MELYSKDIVEILNSNFGYKKVDTPLGVGVKVDCKEAFIFSSITGSGYLDSLIYPFSPKGLLKIFYTALHYKFVTGVFDNSTLRHTPYALSQARKYLFDKDKIIIPYEFEKESDLRSKLNSVFGEEGKNEDYVLLRVETYKQGNGLEPLMEYFACKHFNSIGYITENQIPLSQELGSPDFGGYSLKGFLKEISAFGIFPYGFNVIELALIRVLYEKKEINDYNIDEIVVGEAKTSTKEMEGRLRKYLQSGFFDYGIEIHPFKSAPANDDFGLLTVEMNNIIYKKPNLNKVFSVPKARNEYEKWLEDYFKFYILCNYTNDELNDLFNIGFNRNLSNQDDIVELVQKYSVSDLLKFLIKLMNYGTFK